MSGQSLEPFSRPLLPKQQSCKKFFAKIAILNQFILPRFVNNTTSFKKLHSIIYRVSTLKVEHRQLTLCIQFIDIMPCISIQQ
jgi:hypothetical protein